MEQVTETAGVHTGVTPEQLIELRKKKRLDMNDQEAAELARMLTIRERLERRQVHKEILIDLDDDLGKFTLKFRRLSPKEHDEIAELKAGVMGGDQDKTKMQKIYGILGAASLDGLDEEYWKNGEGFSPDIVIMALLKTVSESSYPDEKYLSEIKKFRLQ